MRYHIWLGAILLVAGCSGQDNGGPTWLDGGPSPPASEMSVTPPPPEDPPPKYCGPAGTTPPALPGGTAACPADLNREGCACTKQGETAPCWPGPRVNRNRGICKDGVTTCKLNEEMFLRWGPCEGAVLPILGAKGAEACGCFSRGTWTIDNTTPCFITYTNNQVYGVSTYLDGTGAIGKCPSNISATPPPVPQPGYSWSKNRLKVDCAGQFKLCFTVKAGDPLNPGSADCALGQACTDVWYGQQNALQELPSLPPWSSNDPACSGKFYQSGGYGEMSVVGLSVECEKVDDGAGNPRVFHRIPYCPVKCALEPSLPECKVCINGGSGDF